jgi:ABC-type antimicrobial peptide transport system permease subunit
MLGIAIGVAAVIALGAFAEGFINAYSTVLTSSGADIIVTQGDAADVILSAVDEVVQSPIANLPGVSKTAGALLGMVSTPEVPYFVVFGLAPNEFAINHYKLIEGTRLMGARQVLLGKVAARNFKKKIGDNYKIQEVSFRVVGIYETGQNIEEMGAVIALQEAQEIFKKPRQVTYYQIQVQRPEVTNQVIAEIEKRFPKLAASRSSNFMDDQQETQMLRAMGSFIGALAVIAGGLVMMNTMLMSVFERTREIGTLRALGWRRRRVVGMIVRESLLLSFLSGLAGIVLGVGLGTLIELEPTMGMFFKGEYTFELLAQAMSVALVLGAIGALYPAWRAANLSPIEALRYE